MSEKLHNDFVGDLAVNEQIVICYSYISCGESPNHFNFNITPHYVNQYMDICTGDVFGAPDWAQVDQVWYSSATDAAPCYISKTLETRGVPRDAPY